MDLKKLSVRTLSGLIYVGIIVGCIFLGELPFTFMAALFGVVATLELERITGMTENKNYILILLDVIGVITLSFLWMIYPLSIWICLIMCRMIMQLYVESKTTLKDLSLSFMSQIYIGLPLGLMTTIGAYGGLHLVLAVFIMIWLNDTGAFLVGSLLGRHRLFQRISPKKSWEGFCGGLLFNLIASALFCYYGGSFFNGDLGSLVANNLGLWLGLGVIVTIFSTWGDLVESLIKRSLEIKDSGNIIPGHGGILDRIDSLLLVMPATTVYLLLIEFFR